LEGVSREMMKECRSKMGGDNRRPYMWRNRVMAALA
jgi:hypothetical protein